MVGLAAALSHNIAVALNPAQQREPEQMMSAAAVALAAPQHEMSVDVAFNGDVGDVINKACNTSRPLQCEEEARAAFRCVRRLLDLFRDMKERCRQVLGSGVMMSVILHVMSVMPVTYMAIVLADAFFFFFFFFFQLRCVK
jgi:hypothetical protein